MVINQIDMVQRCAASFCHNDYKTIEYMYEMIGQLNLEPLNISAQTNDSQYFTKPFGIRGHLACPLEIFSQFCVALDISIAKHSIPSTPVQIFFLQIFILRRTIKDLNSLPEKIASIKEL